MRLPKMVELFGENPKKGDLILIIGFSIVSTLHLILILYSEIAAISLIGQALIVLLCIDISGGVIANLTKSTKSYYIKRPKLEKIFIAIHIQPLILGLIIPGQMAFGTFIYLYAALSTLFVLKMRHHTWHKTLAMSLLMMGIILSFLVFLDSSRLMMLLSILFLTKLIYAFGVNHLD
jgi:hypothetical protein